MMLENEHIKLRAVEPEDLDLLYRWENTPALWAAGDTRNPCSRFTLKQYIVDAQNDIYTNKQLRLMIVEKRGQQTIGTVDLFDFDLHHSRISLGLYVDTEFQGRGYATQSLELLENYVFNFLKINQLNVFIAETNLSSIAIFKKKNYHCSSRLKQWVKIDGKFVDVLVFQSFTSHNLPHEFHE